MALLPQMLQSIEVLQLATADLVAFVDAELQQNETLEDERREVEAPEQQEATSVERDEPSYEEFRRASADGEDKKLGFLNSVPDRKVSAVDQVREQLAFREVPPVLAEIGGALLARIRKKAAVQRYRMGDAKEGGGDDDIGQVYIQEYRQDANLGCHFDSRSAFGELIVGVSIGCESTLLAPRNCGTIEVPDGSSDSGGSNS